MRACSATTIRVSASVRAHGQIGPVPAHLRIMVGHLLVTLLYRFGPPCIVARSPVVCPGRSHIRPEAYCHPLSPTCTIVDAASPTTPSGAIVKAKAAHRDTSAMRAAIAATAVAIAVVLEVAFMIDLQFVCSRVPRAPGRVKPPPVHPVCR